MMIEEGICQFYSELAEWTYNSLQTEKVLHGL